MDVEDIELPLIPTTQPPEEETSFIERNTNLTTTLTPINKPPELVRKQLEIDFDIDKIDNLFIINGGYKFNDEFIMHLSNKIKIEDGNYFLRLNSSLFLKINLRSKNQLYKYNTSILKLKEHTYNKDGIISEDEFEINKTSIRSQVREFYELLEEKNLNQETPYKYRTVSVIGETSKKSISFSNLAYQEIEELDNTIQELNTKILSRGAKIKYLKDLLKNETDPSKQKDLKDLIAVEKTDKSIIEREYNNRLEKVKYKIRKILIKPDSDLSLKSRLKLLFKHLGVTIGTILTAITMVFTTIGLSISNTTSIGPNKPIKPINSIQDKIKDGLLKLAKYLYEIAKKSAAAIPGIIGSIVSFILKSAANLLSFAGEHVILFLIAVISAIVYGLINLIK